MTSRDDQYVVQAARDLLADRGGRRRSPRFPPDRAPAEVVARLGLVHAAQADPRTLLSFARHRELALPLLEQGVAEHRSVDVCDAVSLPVRCGRATHRVRIETDGSLTLSAHPDLDAATERVAVSFGGELLPCLAASDDAWRRWQPPVADDGPRLVSISTGELLAFVRTCRTWASAGWSVDVYGQAVHVGVELDDLAGHLALGLAFDVAVDLVRLPPAEAVRWHACGFASEGVQLWQGQGRTLEDAEAAGGGSALLRWARVTGPRVAAAGLAEWAAFGVPVGVWGEVASRGVRAVEVDAWLAERFEPVAILRYAEHHVPLAEAIRWRDQGFTAFVATGFLEVGMTLADACALRGLPVRVVQVLWSELGSVERILAAT